MTDQTEREHLRASIQAVERKEQLLSVRVRLTNTAQRALHYISDVRAIRYDPAARRLTLALSDEGRQLIPGAVQQEPVFRHVDPGSEAELVLKVPERIIKLSRSAPPGTLAFEKHDLADVQEVVVEVAWADSPYYKDTRARATSDQELPSVRWQQHKAAAARRVEAPAR